MNDKHEHCWHERVDATSFCCYCEDLPHEMIIAVAVVRDENTALREQLAQSERERDTARAFVTRLTIEKQRVEQELAQVTAERDELRKELNKHLPKCSRGAIIGGLKP